MQSSRILLQIFLVTNFSFKVLCPIRINWGIKTLLRVNPLLSFTLKTHCYFFVISLLQWNQKLDFTLRKIKTLSLFSFDKFSTITKLINKNVTYSHTSKADTFFAARQNPYIFHIIILLYSGHLYSGHLVIADTFLEVLFCKLYLHTADTSKIFSSWYSIFSEKLAV